MLLADRDIRMEEERFRVTLPRICKLRKNFQFSVFTDCELKLEVAGKNLCSSGGSERGS